MFGRLAVALDLGQVRINKWMTFFLLWTIAHFKSFSSMNVIQWTMQCKSGSSVNFVGLVDAVDGHVLWGFWTQTEL